VTSKSFAEELNKKQNSWQATSYEWMENIEMEDFQGHLGLSLDAFKAKPQMLRINLE